MKAEIMASLDFLFMGIYGIREIIFTILIGNMKTRNYGNAKKKARQIRRDSSIFYKITQLYIKDYTRKFSFAYKFYMGLKFFMEGFVLAMWIAIYIVDHRIGRDMAMNLCNIVCMVQIVLDFFIVFHFGWEDRKTKYERSCGL